MQRVRRLHPQSLRIRLELGNNGLNALRLALAAMVIVSHAAPLAGLGEDPRIGVVSFGGVAVAGFFALSGYLVTNSREHSSIGTFAVRRFARIYPGYWLCLILTAFPLAALVGLERGGWTPQGAVEFVALNCTLVFLQGTVGSTLTGAPVDTTWNGSLWTLPVEVSCYVGIALLLALPFVRKNLRATSAIGLAGLTALDFLAVAGTGQVLGILYLATFFASGVFLYAWRHTVRLNAPTAAAAAAAFVIGYQSDATVMLAALPGAYLFLWLGAVMPAPLRSIGATNDISYGVYLYGWPVQQTLAAYGVASAGVVAFTAASLVCALPLAYLSWILVERPASRTAKRHTPRPTPVTEAMSPT